MNRVWVYRPRDSLYYRFGGLLQGRMSLVEGVLVNQIIELHAV